MFDETLEVFGFQKKTTNGHLTMVAKNAVLPRIVSGFTNFQKALIRMFQTGERGGVGTQGLCNGTNNFVHYLFVR